MRREGLQEAGRPLWAPDEKKVTRISGRIKAQEWKVEVFDSWEEAARKSKMKMAVSEPFFEPVYSKTRKKTEMVRVEIIKPLFGDPFVVYATTMFKVRKAAAKECDGVKKWKSYR